MPVTHARVSGWASLRIVCVAWLVLAPLLAAPLLLAVWKPPVGRDFSGAFFFQDDYQQYLSFVEQASRGSFFFLNKFDLRPQEPFLVNLTWWTAGILSVPLGHDPRLGFMAMGALSLMGWLTAAVGFLKQGGLAGGHLVWALGLVTTGSGLGWARLRQGSAWSDIPDLGTLLFPWAQAVVSPHALAASAMLLAALTFFLKWLTGGPRWRWLVCASLLGVMRPYDLAVFGAVAVVALLADVRHRRGRVARVLDLLWLAPVLFYDALVFLWHPSFAVFTAQNAVAFPPWNEFVWALGPVALLGCIRPTGARRTEAARVAGLGAIALTGVLLLVRIPYTLQLSNSLGLLLLLRASLVLPRPALPIVMLALCPTSFYLLSRTFDPPVYWFPPADYTAAALLLRERCQPQDVVLAPLDPGLIIAGLASCNLVLGHRVLTPDLTVRVEETSRFYNPATSAHWRQALMFRLGVRHVLLPPGKGEWIEGSGFTKILARRGLDVWSSAVAR